MTPEERMALAKRAALEITLAIGEAIRDLGAVPAGHLYAAAFGVLPLMTFQLVIDRLVEAKLVARRNHLLVWVGDDAQLAQADSGANSASPAGGTPVP